MNVRHAVMSDVPWLVLQLRAFSDFFSSKIPLFPADEDYARKQLEGLITNHYFRIAHVGEERIGFVAAVLSKHFFNPEIITATEIFWWVALEHRLSRAAALLLIDYIEWGRQNCNWVALGLEHNSAIKDTTLLRHGFKLKERSYLMEVG